MVTKGLAKVSKFLSYVLRHRPDEVGLELDPEGWVGTEELLEALGRHGHKLQRAELVLIVASSDKQRFALSPDGSAIRANQGHSVEVDLGYEPSAPPELLFHGTVGRFLDSIREQGLVKGNRHHVHLSPDSATAKTVGSRRGRPVILTVLAGSMTEHGHEFYLSENGVWLTERVPPEYLHFPD